MTHPLQCRCGTLRGHLTLPAMASAAKCYCKDCQAAAHVLGHADTVLDANGGTQIIAILPERVHITQGLDALACMSLSDRGLLRWHAGCCNTPITNTPRSRNMPYAGVIHTCLAKQSPSLEQSLGPVRIALNVKSARGEVKGTPMQTTLSMLQIGTAMFGARLRGAANRNLFFDADSGAPIRQPRVLTEAQRASATPGGPASG